MSGLRLEDLTADDILNNMQYYYDLFIEYRKLGFVELHPTRDQQEELVKLFADAPESNSLFDVVHPHLEERLKEAPDDFLIGHWHTDNTVFEVCPNVTSMHMHYWKGTKGTGNTVLVDLQDLYDKCPKEYINYLQALMVHHRSGMDNPDGTLHPGAHHPALRSHPTTGKTCLWYTGPECDPTTGPDPLFDEYKDWMRTIKETGQLYQPENQFSWEWTEGDFLVWDNTCVVHAFYGGWEYGKRKFDKVEAGYSRPFFTGPWGTMMGRPIESESVSHYG